MQSRPGGWRTRPGAAFRNTEQYAAHVIVYCPDTGKRRFRPHWQTINFARIAINFGWGEPLGCKIPLGFQGTNNVQRDHEGSNGLQGKNTNY